MAQQTKMAGEIRNKVQTPKPPQLLNQRMAITKMAKVAIRTATAKTAYVVQG
jgi:hypothetical protein